MPANPLLAEPMYLAGYIERLGTGTSDMVIRAGEAGLRELDFIQEEDFKVINYRTGMKRIPQDFYAPTDHVIDPVKKLVLILKKELFTRRNDGHLGFESQPDFLGKLPASCSGS